MPISQASLEKKTQDENDENQPPPGAKLPALFSYPKEKSRLPLAELILDNNIPSSDHNLPIAPTSPTKTGSLAVKQGLSPTGIGQTPECHWAASLAPSLGHNLMNMALSPVGLDHPMSPSGSLYPASPLGIPTPSPSALDMISQSILSRGTLDALMAQHQANPQSGTPGLGLPAYDAVLLPAPSSMETLLAAQQYRDEANQSLLQQHQIMPLDERLASLDACVRDLAADVRNLHTAPTAAMPMARSAPAPVALFRDATNVGEPENMQAAQPKSFRI